MIRWLKIFPFIFLLTTIVCPQTIFFNRLTTEHGLSNNTVFDIIQDKFGFLWFATEDGLHRFDGYDFKIFRNNLSNENSISDNSIWTLIEDRKGCLWLGTKNGWLNRFDPLTEKFTKWKIRTDNVKENAINVVYEDSQGKIWIGTYRSGIYRLNPVTGKIDHWFHIPEDKTSLSNNYVSSIVEDDKGNFLIATYNGLNKFNPNSSQNIFERYYKIDGRDDWLSNNLIWKLTRSEIEPDIIWISTADGLTKYDFRKEKFSQIKIPNPQNIQFGTSASSVLEVVNLNKENILWVGSYAGLVMMNISNGKSKRFVADEMIQGSISSNQINRILKDRSGVLWLATDKGLNYTSLSSNKFNYYAGSEFNLINPSSINTKDIKAINITSDNTIWFGTDNGLFFTKISENGKLVQKIPQTEKLNIWSLSSDCSGNLWIGTYGSGLFKLDLKSKILQQVKIFSEYSNLPSVNFNKVVYCDSENKICIGYWGFGFALFDQVSGKYKRWLNDPKDPNSISYEDIWSIYKDRNGRIWIGTDGGGLNLFADEEGGKFHRWTAGGDGSISSNSIYAICESKNFKTTSDDEVILWLGTNNGLNKFVVKKSPERVDTFAKPLVEITQYGVEQGLADNFIKSLVEDNNGNLWIGTSSGISLFDIQQNKFINFSKTDGLTGTDINLSSVAKNKDGLIFMGSTEGLNYFNPSDIKLSSYTPPIVITDFQIFNKSVEISDDSPLKTSLINTDEIELNYSQNVFSFQFAALDYISPKSNKYAYKMEGFDKEWFNSETRRYVTYTNLKPGKYNFKVKATNSDGVWSNDVKELKVIILPPWWQTFWAISVYVLIVILGVWGIVRFQNYRIRLQNELKMQEFEAHHLREIESMKSRFFANLSHEFRTPLTLIKGPLEQLISGRIKDNLSDYYKMLLRNTEKLQNLIDQLLELSQLEAETIPLNKQAHDLVNLLKSLTYNFKPLAEERLITLSFNSSVENLTLMIDRDKLEKIINNLLSNAFKFTPSGGKISVDLLQDESSNNNDALVKVSDTGAGIPKEYQSKLFDRFFKVEDELRRSQTGSGIGLALVKELADLHKWEISVESTEGVQTIFTLKIPIEKEIEDVEKQKLNSHLDSDILIENVNAISNDVDQETEAEEVKTQEEKAVILFVEDSSDVRSYLQDLLKADFNVLLAESAEDAIEIILKNSPDLIISDLMMPGMDGIEFCNKIKTDWQTSHIPFILLTAKVTDESKIQGLETGADDYLTKPFNYEELFVRIKNLIEQRKRLREKFSKEINIQPALFTSNKLDSEFLQKVIMIAEKNISNENFDTEFLAKEMFVSRRQLHRKLQAITDQGPGEFIRSFRLKRAAQLLLENKLSVTQVALEVGFESPGHFTRAFKKYFNILPSDFNNQARFKPKPVS